MRRTPLRRISERRLLETDLYRRRLQQFLLAHPYCQLWLTEHGVAESLAIERHGIVHLPDNPAALVPLATQVHHKNKRRGADLLDENHWLAVSRDAHERIENHKAWARARGYLEPF